ncbi:BTB/POZ domain-containing protein KCTD6, partial [Stylophora pistillata]
MLSNRISKKGDSHKYNDARKTELSSSGSSKKDLPDDKALDEVNKHITNAFGILRREISKVRKEKEAFEEVAKKLEHVHFSTMLKLNVGGHLFSTSLETMNKDPGSVLHAMFSGRFGTKPGEDGTYFIDRDGTNFRYILNYLRTGKLLLPEDTVVRKELLSEAEFYQIEGILSELKAQPFQDSVILSSEQRHILIDWLRDRLESASEDYVLLYHATRNGWNASNFHSICHREGPTLTVMKSEILSLEDILRNNGINP